MLTRLLLRMILMAPFVGGLCLEVQRLSAAQMRTNAAFDSSSAADEKKAADNEQVTPSPSKLDEIIDRMIKREHDEIAAFDQYTPIIETYIQEVKINELAGAVPKSDYYFLGQADFRGRLKVHSMTVSSRKGSLLWSFDPAGFLQMIFIDRGHFAETITYKPYGASKGNGRSSAALLLASIPRSSGKRGCQDAFENRRYI